MDKSSSESTNDLQVLKKMEDEHCRLQRQFRTIQTDRQNRTMGVHPQLRKQDHLLRTLKKEYVNILTDLKIAKSGAHKKKRSRLESNLKQALLLRVHIMTKCHDGITMMNQTEGVLRRNSKEVLKLKKLFNISRGEIQKRKQQSENRLVSTENRLEAAMLRFNAVQGDNRRIRENIEHMLKERAIFNQNWSKMLTALSKGKKFLCDLFESSALAYDQRDEWCSKLRSMQEKGKVDQTQQIQEMRDLQKAFDHETKLYEFLARKGVKRINRKQEKREEDQTKEEIESTREQLDKLLKILNDIHEYSQEPDLDKIIENFHLVEHNNFSTYLLMSTYCAENVVLQKKFKAIIQDVADRRNWNEKQEEERQNKLQKLKDELAKKQKITDELREKSKEQDRIIAKLMRGIEEMFTFLECSVEPFQKLLGDKKPSINQLKLSLKLIGEKISQQVQVVCYCERMQKKKDKSSSSRLKKYLVHPPAPAPWSATEINLLVPASPCPA
ncbi:hypothetical protein ACJJTC_005219 [Scirpophaga incertulas]